uniref:testin-like n=1 Tax=Styela clava TaxID=7725 RepID=UPI00193933A5|nr:testin-like [Styela clava]
MTEIEVVSGITEKVLTHEVGAGAPCLKCGNKCPGLDLHFWRKICRNCKCKQEDHAVQEEVSSRGIENIGKLLMHDQGLSTETNTVPVKRESPTKPKYSSPDKSKTPVNGHFTVTNNYSDPAPPPPVRNVETIGTMSQQPLKVTVDIGGKQHQLDFGGATLDPSFPAPPPPQNNTSEAPPMPPPPAELASPDLPPPPPDMQSYAQSTSPPVPPMPQEYDIKVQEPTRQTYTSSVSVTTTTQKEIPPPVPPTDRRDSSSSSSSSDGEKSGGITYEWQPPVKDSKLAKQFIESLPKEKQPIKGTEGGQYRRKQLMRQLPPHDQEPSACHDLTSQEKQEMDVFVTQYREKALGVGNVDGSGKIKSCTHCNQGIKVGDVMVLAERAGPNKVWHPQCFVCSECKELLVDLIYFYQEDKIYCGRHYCELHKPRCAACDELIFAPEYTQAEDCYWHLKHFCCWQCDQPLGGKNYVPHDNQPVCIPCYEKEFAHRCATCKNVIAPNIEWVTFQEHHWHALPECFRCSNCSQSLVGKPCIPKGDMVFCSSKCKKEKLPPQ